MHAQSCHSRSPSAPDTHTPTHQLNCMGLVQLFRGGKKKKLLRVPLSTHPFKTNSRCLPSLHLAASLSLPPLLPQLSCPSRSQQHTLHTNSHQETPANITNTEKRANTSGKDKKKKTQGIGGALISYFTLSNCWHSPKGNPWL